MANTLLTPSVITKESLMILHQECNFIGNIGLQYDDRYAKTGAKIGADLKIRKPNKFVTRTGKTINTQDVTEQSSTLTVGTQMGVDFEFDADDLTLTIDMFSERYLKPAMSTLAANIESTVLESVYKDVYNFHDGVSAANDFDNMTEAARILDDNLAPRSQRCMIHTPRGATDLVNANKALFHDSKELSKAYRDASIGRFAGFDHYVNTLVPSHTTGTETEGDTGYNIAASQSGSSITISGGTQTFLAGDIVTLEGCNRVHPETKVDTGTLQQFVVTANSGATATALSISPSIVTSGATQNVSGVPTTNGAVNKIGGGASDTWKQSIGFHKDAFAIAFADLVMPKGVHFAAREVMDNISMRIVSDYDITNDAIPTRIDVLFGWLTPRPELAVRVGHNS